MNIQNKEILFGIFIILHYICIIKLKDMKQLKFNKMNKEEIIKIIKEIGTEQEECINSDGEHVDYCKEDEEYIFDNEDINKLAELLSETWINIKDKLPTDNYSSHTDKYSEEVLITNYNDIFIGCYNRENDRWFCNEPANPDCVDKITHWKPLPKNPNK